MSRKQNEGIGGRPYKSDAKKSAMSEAVELKNEGSKNLSFFNFKSSKLSNPDLLTRRKKYFCWQLKIIP